MDRFAFYLPGWEMPKNGSELLTDDFGLITDYLAEAFHHLFKHSNRYAEVNERIRLGAAVQGRDEKGIKKMLAAFLKILHPDGPPSDSEFEEYVAYAVEGRRRVKEQMNKRKADDEFALIQLSYFGTDSQEHVVFCPESKGVAATQNPSRRELQHEFGPRDSEFNPQADSGVSDTANTSRDPEVDSPSHGGFHIQASPKVSIDELLANGETGSVEFKSSLQWDMIQGKKNEELRGQVMRTVAAFLNSQGGTLLVGVKDSGEVCGLEDDLRILRQSRDLFDRTVVSLLMDQIGPELMSFVKLRFDTIDGKDIYIIEVNAAPKPAFAKTPKGKEFFIRVGSTTQPLDSEAAMKYIQARWR